jgi:hypothetical protein
MTPKKLEVCSQGSTADVSIARQRLSKHFSAATNEHAITEELLDVIIYIRSCPKL